MREKIKIMTDTAHLSSKGFALASAMLIVLLLAGISAGTMYLVNTESRLGATDLESTQAYYGAEAAMEKMMVDLNFLYAAQLAPTVAAIEALGDSSLHPLITDITFPAYDFTIPNVAGEPITEVRPISAGPNEGLTAFIVPLTLGVTARGPTGVEARMERDIQMALIPVFQFGVFSDVDLAYHPGPGFNFTGRVHTNGDLYLCASAATGLVFHSKLTAVGDIIRANMMNGLDVVALGRDEPVWIPTAPAGCDGAGPGPACRDLQEDEGSLEAGPGSADTAGWADLSLTTYNGFIVNGDTGASPMELPFVEAGVSPRELLLRPPAGEDPTSLMGVSRLYNMAQLRVLISDDESELPGGDGVQLANVAPYYTGGNDYGATETAFPEGKVSWDSDQVEPPGLGGGNPSWPLVDGYLLVEARQADGSFDDVTMEWLDLGISRANPDAILKFQEMKDDDGDGTPDHDPTASNLKNVRRQHILGLYDPREGEVRDVSLGAGSTSCAIGGIMSIVELDVGNLKRWLDGTTPTNGANVDSVPQNGYVFYFSDRRGMLENPDGDKVGEYGFEDVINPADAAGAPNGALDTAEDVNQNGELETYGADNLGDAFGVANGDPTIRIDCNTIGRKNRVSGARHALKLDNGSLGNVPTKPDGTGGFTVATENPVYVKGHYNADGAGYGDPHASAAIIADALTVLSVNWEDWQSFIHPTYTGATTERNAADTYYRMAVAAGKAIYYPHPGWAVSDNNYGNDGGTHNFLRYLERWSDDNWFYRGSLVSLYYSQYAVGIFKYSDVVYVAPTRNAEFDDDFLDIDKLPPGTPRFRDVVNLGMRQVFTPD